MDELSPSIRKADKLVGELLITSFDYYDTRINLECCRTSFTEGGGSDILLSYLFEGSIFDKPIHREVSFIVKLVNSKFAVFIEWEDDLWIELNESNLFKYLYPVLLS